MHVYPVHCMCGSRQGTGVVAAVARTAQVHMWRGALPSSPHLTQQASTPPPSSRLLLLLLLLLRQHLWLTAVICNLFPTWSSFLVVTITNKGEEEKFPAID